MQRSKRVLVVLVSAVVVLAIAAFVWAPKWFVASQRSDDAPSEARSNFDAVVLAAPEEVRELDENVARRAVALESSEPAPAFDGPVAEMPLSPHARHFVRVVARDDPWLVGSFHGNLNWTAASGSATALVIDHSRIELPRAPRSVDEFSDVIVAGLLAHAVELMTLDAPASADASSPQFELRIRLDEGAVVDWAPSVPLHERTAVDLALGGSFSPASGVELRFNVGAGVVDQRRGLELPVTLPRVSTENSVWVGAEGRQWRAFALTPESERVEVVLERSASLLVHHDAPSGSTVVVQEWSGAKSRAAIFEPGPITLDGLTAGKNLVWIEGFGRGESQAVNVELVAGEVVEVDLSTAALSAARGGVRLTIRAAPEVLALSPLPIEAYLHKGTSENHIGQLRELERERSETDGIVFEADGLESGIHTIRTSPFGGSVEFDVQQGTKATVELVYDCVGFAEFVLPHDVDARRVSVVLSGQVAGSGLTSINALRASIAENAKQPVLCGTYTASASQWSDGQVIGLMSDPFVVTTGATTIVELRPRPLSRIEFAAIDSSSGASIGFDIEFWVGMRIADRVTGEEVKGFKSFTGQSGAYTGMVLSIDPYEGLVLLTPLDDPFWTFEPLDAVELTDGAAITLRASAR